MSPVLVNASEGQGEGLEQSPEEPGAQGVLSRALPWGPAGCAQFRVRINHSHKFGTGPFLTSLSQHLTQEKEKLAQSETAEIIQHS